MTIGTRCLLVSAGARQGYRSLYIASIVPFKQPLQDPLQCLYTSDAYYPKTLNTYN